MTKITFLLFFSLATPFFVYAQNWSSPVIVSRDAWITNGTIDYAALLDQRAKKVMKDRAEHPTTPPLFKKPDMIVAEYFGCETMQANTLQGKCNASGSEARSLIYNTFLFHTYARNAGDIGYHFIIDTEGTIYQGRKVRNGFLGEYGYDVLTCSNYAPGSLGIGLIGTGKKEDSSVKQLSSLRQLLTFLLYANGIENKTPKKIWQDSKEDNNCRKNNGRFVERKDIAYPVVLRNTDLDFSSLIKGALDDAAFLKNLLFKRSVNTEEKKYFSFRDGFIFEKEKIGGIVMELDGHLVDFFEHESPKLSPVLEGQVISVEGSDRYYKIKDGFRVRVPHGLIQLGTVKKAPTIIVTTEILLSYPLRDGLEISENFLYRENGGVKIYFFERSALHHINSYQLLAQDDRFNSMSIVDLDKEEFTEIPLGQPYLFKEGTLLKSQNNHDVYIIEHQRRRKIISFDVFKQWGFDFSQVLIVPEGELRAAPLGEPLLYKNGTLIKTAEDFKIYYTWNGIKYWIYTGTVARNARLKVREARVVSDEEFRAYREGEIIKNSKEIALLEGKVYSPVVTADDTIRILLSEFTRQEGFFGVRMQQKNDIVIEDGKKKISVADTNEILFTFDELYATYGGYLSIQSKNNSQIEVVLPESHDTILNEPPLIVQGKIEFIFENSDTGESRLRIVGTATIENLLRNAGALSPDDGTEFARAFVIAQRSNLVTIVQSHKRATSVDNQYDIDGRDVLVAYGRNDEIVSKILEDAASSTYGMVLMYDNALAPTVFSLDTGGKSLDAREVLGQEYEKYPYLWGGIEDPLSTRHDPEGVEKSNRVGISLEGSREMSRLGYSSQEILQKYFPGTEIKKIY